MNSNLSINHVWLNTYLRLVETGHFTKTAESLYMTQPGVSQHIKKLEQQLNVVLLQRIGKRFELTEAGTKLYQHGKQLAKIESETLSSLQTDSETEGECKISCSGSLAMLIYKDCLARQAKHSGLSFSVRAQPNHAITQQILNNEIDLGIVTQKNDEAELVYEEVGKEQLRLVLPKSQRENVDYDALANLGFINHPDGHHYASRVLAANFSEQFSSMEQIKQRGFINQLTQILEPVVFGLGFTVLPEYAVSQFAATDKLTTAKLSNPIIDKLYVVYKQHRKLPVRYHWFIDLVKQKTQN